MPVLDIVAEGLEPDLGSVKKDLGRAKQPLRGVDNAKVFQRRGVGQRRRARRRAFRAP